MTTDLLRLLLAPALVVGITLVGRRWGARIAGRFAGFPFVGGPILLVIALEHDAGFAARAATASLLGLTAWVAFNYVYLALARRGRGVLTSTLVGWAAFVVLGAALTLLPTSPAVGLAAVIASIVLATRFWPRTVEPADPASLSAAPASKPAGHGDLAARAAAACVLVATITLLAGQIGPVAAGVLAPFPILSTILAAFTHQREGVVQTERLLAGMLVGVRGFVAFSFVLSVTLDWLSTPVAFLLASLAAGLATTLATRGGRDEPAAAAPPQAERAAG